MGSLKFYLKSESECILKIRANFLTYRKVRSLFLAPNLAVAKTFKVFRILKMLEAFLLSQKSTRFLGYSKITSLSLGDFQISAI
ncbi:MAG: hypothetical protein CVT89_07910 [Candidatus Altiarchaeales archaeon HGW-Altiarchaeales-2]|nr:MAG: hypothetical protein CVT89_07910 [Candidatus Altiarchaeales archaeon HGW-Altiarchaeales-2]